MGSAFKLFICCSRAAPQGLSKKRGLTFALSWPILTMSGSFTLITKAFNRLMISALMFRANGTGTIQDVASNQLIFYYAKHVRHGGKLKVFFSTTTNLLTFSSYFAVHTGRYGISMKMRVWTAGTLRHTFDARSISQSRATRCF